MKKFLFMILLSISLTNLMAEDLQSLLKGLGQNVAKGYLSPLSNAFGSNINTGWVHRAAPNKFLGLDLEINVITIATPFSSSDKNFSVGGTFNYVFTASDATTIANQFDYSSIKAPDDATGTSTATATLRAQVKNQLIKELQGQNLTYKLTIAGPTIIGKKSEYLKVKFDPQDLNVNVGGNNYTVKVNSPVEQQVNNIYGYLNGLSALPFGVPQISLGTVYGTQVTVRGLPSIEIDKDLGKFSYFGIGLNHNIDQWIPLPIPFNLSAGFFTQTMKVGDIFKSNGTTFGIFASKTFGFAFLNVTPYGNLTFENSTTKVNYDLQVLNPATNNTEIIPISFDLSGGNKTKFTIGSAFKIGIINLNVEYGIAKYNTISAGLGIII
jgi:hypothetical protein